MEITFLLKITALALVGVICAVFLKDSRLPVLAVLTILAAGVIIFLQLLPQIQLLWSEFSLLGEAVGVNSEYVTLILKVIALAYLSEFGAQVCRDAGQGTAALKIELAARIAIMILAFPVLTAIIRTLLALLSP